METIHTPLIDAALAHTRLVESFTSAKNTVTADQVYKSALADVKHYFSHALEAALEPITWKFTEKYRGMVCIRAASGGPLDRNDCDPTYYVQLNHCGGLPKKLKKFAHLPEIQEYLAVVAEGAILWAAVEAAKARAISGRKPSANAKPVDLTNMGTCTICGNLQKLNGNGMAHHGFKISNGNKQYFGRRSGKCFGCAYPPYEQSCEGNKAYKPLLEVERSKLASYLDRLLGGKITELKKEERVPLGRGKYDTKTVIVKLGESDWQRLYETRKADLEWKIRGLNRAIIYLTKVAQASIIKAWETNRPAGSHSLLRRSCKLP